MRPARRAHPREPSDVRRTNPQSKRGRRDGVPAASRPLQVEGDQLSGLLSLSEAMAGA